MDIIFISSYDANDSKSWSGTPNAMLNALKGNKLITKVETIGPYNSKIKIFLKYLSFILKKITGFKYDYSHNIFVALEYKCVFQYRLKNKQADYIICPGGASESSFLKTTIPIIYTSDATFSQMCNYYDSYKKIFKFSIFEANYIEHLAIHNASYVTYPSLWAVNSAINDYSVNNTKVKHILWGANFNYIPQGISRNPLSSKNIIKLLFVGVDWSRKGGSIAVACVKHLRDHYNLNVELHVCGVTDVNETYDWLIVHGRFDKNKEQDLHFIKKLYEDSDIFILPTQQECYGMVFCEASAFSLPIITTHTGGVTSIVIDNYNGFTIHPEKDYTEFSSKIYELITNDELYLKFSKNARSRYETQLNWNVWAEELLNFIQHR